MKVKFYKGPYHGKVRDHMIMDFNHPIRMALYPKVPSTFYYDAANANATIRVDTHIYKIKMMSVRDSVGTIYTAPATHPDGSLFYEYQGKE